jgi:hypothetical protein
MRPFSRGAGRTCETACTLLSLSQSRRESAPRHWLGAVSWPSFAVTGHYSGNTGPAGARRLRRSTGSGHSSRIRGASLVQHLVLTKESCQGRTHQPARQRRPHPGSGTGRRTRRPRQRRAPLVTSTFLGALGLRRGAGYWEQVRRRHHGLLAAPTRSCSTWGDRLGRAFRGG